MSTEPKFERSPILKKKHGIKPAIGNWGFVCLNEEIVARARIFNPVGMRTFDALHLACAESTHAVFITSYDKIITILQKNPDLTYNQVKKNHLP